MVPKIMLTRGIIIIITLRRLTMALEISVENHIKNSVSRKKNNP
jgi:hypothetical protein